MATLTYIQPTVTGTLITSANAAASGDAVAPHPNGLVTVTNTSGADRTVTLINPATEYGQAIGDIAITIATGTRRGFLPLPDLANPSTGLVEWTYDDHTGVTVSALMV